jgi:sialate O-acetylesterase
VLLGEVWLCSGQSNMEMPMYGFGGGQFTEGAQEFIATANPSRPIRMAQLTREYSSTPLEDCKTKWMVNNPEAVSQISATAYFFADYIQKTLQIPVGIIVSSWGGSNIETWIDKETLDKTISGIDYSFLNDPEAQKRNPNQRPTLLYNAMIMPIKNYTIQGVIWYQGESNIGNYQKYPALQKAMVEKWRSLFNNPDMPYLYTQIAPYIYSNGENRESAFQQEAQAKSLAEISNSGMAVTVDIGELTCIHPAKKREVGERLAYWALAETYDIAGINYKSPSYVSMQIKNDTINVAFDECDRGLYYGPGREETITGFEIAGEDKVFHPAIAKIRGKEIEVKSPDVASPVAVRYCFKNYQPGYLYNNSGLPVAPFRTDNWEK